MKKYLLSLAAAALLGSPAFAQVGTANLKLQQKPMTEKMLKAFSGVNGLQTGSVVLQSANRQSREINEHRPSGLLSYMIDGTEMQKTARGGFGMNFAEFKKNTGGADGYGISQAYMHDLLQRYKGNTIKQIDFAVWYGQYTDPMVFIADMTTGQMLWTAPVENFKASTKDGWEMNSVPCDYQITGNEGMLMIGWASRKVVADPADPDGAKAGPTVCMIPDNTGLAQGAWLWGTTADGQMQMLMNASVFGDENGGKMAYSSLMNVITEGPNGVKNLDASAMSVSSVRANIGAGVKTMAMISNLGLEPIKSLDYEFTINGEKKTGSYKFNSGLYYCGSTNIQLDVPVAKEAGRTIADFKITKLNAKDDEYTEDNDNVASFPYLAFTNSYTRVPVVEEFTATGCPWCPKGIAGLEKLGKEVGNAVRIAAHPKDFNGVPDPLYAANYDAVIQNYASNFPFAVVNREYGGDPYDDVVGMSKSAAASPCEANLTVKGSKPNNLTGKIKASSEVEFLFDAPAGAYSVVYVITEDGVTGVKQTNNFAVIYQDIKQKNPNLNDEGIFRQMERRFGLKMLDNPDLQEIAKAGHPYEPTFNHTAVIVTDGFGGMQPSQLPAIKAGQKISHSVEIELPKRTPAIKNSNLSIAALLIDNASGVVVTGAQAELGKTSEPSAIESVEGNEFAEIEAADGAFTVKADNAKAAVYSVDGKLISSCTVNGQASLPTFGKGVFVIRVEANGHVMTKKAIF